MTQFPILINLYDHHQYIWKNAWNDLRYHHSGTGLGVFWNFINPIIEIAIYAGVFTLLISTEGRDSSYVLYLSAGLLPWRSFSSTILQGSNAFIQHATHLKRLGLPPEIFVAKITLSSTFMVFIYLAILLPTNWLFGNQPGWEVVFLPLLAVLLQGFAFGIALVLAHLRAFFLDLGQVLPILLYAWRWSMPIIYTDVRISEDIQSWLHLIPPYVFIQSIRDVIMEQKVPSFDQWSFMVGFLLVSLLIGSLVLQKLQYEVREVI